ncbi:hypothetical protein ABZ208_35460 [Streptomyces sp. NPDC006208]|uniref:hypothetical protein n=1 Tax=Streptomyces sp. NPDC006208 TaxID=3156734 RepID=UPI0033A68483
MADRLGPIDYARQAAAQREQRPPGRHTADTITDDDLDRLYERLAKAEAAIDRVRVVADRWQRNGTPDLNRYARIILAALDDPTTA